jgi:hypothetical protein
MTANTKLCPIAKQEPYQRAWIKADGVGNIQKLQYVEAPVYKS